jgi:N-carbamoyl-L-amino-acid hydrolase
MFSMEAFGENLRIDGARLWDATMEMAKTGPSVAGGNDGHRLTDADERRAGAIQAVMHAGRGRVGLSRPHRPAIPPDDATTRDNLLREITRGLGSGRRPSPRS